MKSSYSDLKRHLKDEKKKVDEALKKFLPKLNGKHLKINEAMHYAVFSGGKRIRAILALEANRLCRGTGKGAMRHACAVELLHNYSLVHDDLPVMDDDDLRRGRKTVHKKYDEATALLAGDALLTLAFGVIAGEGNPSVSKNISRVLAEDAGYTGMIGGQSVDLAYAQKRPTQAIIDFIHVNKTAKLIAAAVEIGALSAKAPAKDVRRLRKFGELIGFVFQLTDDIIDEDGYCRLMGKSATYRQANLLTERAVKLLHPFGGRANRLTAIAHFILKRTY